MITSLNINQFLGTVYTEEIKDTDVYSNMKSVLYYVKKHLINETDIVFLHEMPVKYKEEFKKELSRILEELLFFEPSQISGKVRFITLAICFDNKKISDIKLQPFILSQKNRIIFLKQLVEIKDNIYKYNLIIGIHAPSEDVILFWQSLCDLISKILPYYCMNALGYDQRIDGVYIVGDFNVYSPNTIQKKYFYKLLSFGLLDNWIENDGKNSQATYITEKSKIPVRLDYALVSENKNSYYETLIDDSARESFTDHSAIILKEKKNNLLNFLG